MYKKLIKIALLCWTTGLFAVGSIEVSPVLFENPYGIVSLLVKMEDMQSPMAHPIHHIETINVDSRHHRLLNFSDLFSDENKALQIISRYAQVHFMKKLQQENLPQENATMRAEMIQAGTSGIADHYRHWNIKPGYLRIVFERAQIAPSYFGEQVIDIPLSLLVNVINQEIFPQTFRLYVEDFLFLDLACWMITQECCHSIRALRYPIFMEI